MALVIRGFESHQTPLATSFLGWEHPLVNGWTRVRFESGGRHFGKVAQMVERITSDVVVSRRFESALPDISEWSNGRTTISKIVDQGSIPCSGACLRSSEEELRTFNA